MSWTGQGGGGPWGPPPDDGTEGQRKKPGPEKPRRGPAPPGLEDMIRKAGERLGGSFPFGHGGMGLLGLAVAAVMVLWLASGVYRVQADERAVELFLGKVHGAPVGPGLHYHWPWPFQSVYRVRTLFENQVVIGAGEEVRTREVFSGRMMPASNADDGLMLTGDKNIINIVFAVRWVISDPEKYLFRVRDPEDTVRKAAASAIREVVGQTRIDDILTGTGQAAASADSDTAQKISIDVRASLQGMLDSYGSGIQVTGVELKTAEVPREVVQAYLEVLNASQERERLRNEAESYRNSILPESRGQAERILQEAEAYRDRTVSLAKGEAQRYMSVYEAYTRSKDVTARRMYLETLESILRETPKVIIDDNALKGQGVLPWLPLDTLGTGQVPAMQQRH
ncbi:MAG: FtsH protease activity modulator HflK [Pseudomonadota bacterium]|nr:FtsH protease activity modulator HflK [Pseudomonadota bacterium]